MDIASPQSGPLPGGAALDRAALLEALAATPPLVEGLTDPAVQVQPNGIDLTLAAVFRLEGAGRIGLTNADRMLPELVPVEPEAGWFTLGPGLYQATLNETVHIPLDLTGLGWPRSSLLRSGVTIHTAVWDAGYFGRSQVLLSVVNPAGFRVAVGARIVQMVFFRLTNAVQEGYQGVYQGGNFR